MPRGKRDIERTRRIILKLRDSKLLFKQIAYEEGVTERVVSFVYAKFFTVERVRKLNEKGIKILNEEQLYFTF